MPTSASDQLTSPDSRFFLAFDNALHRQYEALRAYFVEGLPSHQAAERFGYTAGSFRVLCHQFRHDPEKRPSFFRPAAANAPTPARDNVRELVIAMRKRNLSVYDIQDELADDNRSVSIHTIGAI